VIRSFTELCQLRHRDSSEELKFCHTAGRRLGFQPKNPTYAAGMQPRSAGHLALRFRSLLLAVLLSALLLLVSATWAVGTPAPIETQTQATALINAGLATKSLTNLRSVLAADVWPDYGHCRLLRSMSLSTWAGPNVCRFGATGSSSTMLLVGDSRAEILIPAMSAVGKQLGMKLVPLTMAGCWFNKPGSCPNYPKWVADEITQLKPRVVLVAGKFLGPKSLTAPEAVGLISVLRSWAGLGSSLVLLGNTPTAPLEPQVCMAIHPKELTKCNFALSWSVSKWLDLKAIAKVSKVAYAPLSQVLCTTKCPAVINGIAAYVNAQHASPQVLEAMAKPIAAALKGTFPID
jgi:hypothetical protein